MTNENMQTNNNMSSIPPVFVFGAKLRSTREAMGIDRKDVAAQLRLSENLIDMLEKDTYPNDLPVTFVRGYIRLYGKFLQLPDYEIKQAIEPIQPKLPPLDTPPPVVKSAESLTSGNYYMRFFTFMIIITMVGLVGIWWFNHNKTATVTGSISEDKTIPLPEETKEASRLPLPASPVAVVPTSSNMINSNKTVLQAPAAAPSNSASTQLAAHNASAPTQAPTQPAPGQQVKPADNLSAPTPSAKPGVKPAEQAATNNKPAYLNKPAYAEETDEADDQQDNND